MENSNGAKTQPRQRTNQMDEPNNLSKNYKKKPNYLYMSEKSSNFAPQIGFLYGIQIFKQN